MALKKEKLGVAFVEITAEHGKFTKGINAAYLGMKELDKDTRARLTKMGAGMLAFGAATVAGVGMAVGRFADFEKTIRNVQAVSNATGEEFVQLKNFAMEMGQETAFTAKQAGEGMYYLASAGLSVAEQMKTTAAVLDLAAATQADMAQSSSMVVISMSAFNIEAAESRRIADVFAESIASSQAQMSKLETSIPYTATLFNSLGWSIEDNVAALSGLYDQGLRAEMAGTQLRTAIKQLLDPTDDMVASMESLGISMEAVNPATHSLVEIVAEFERVGLGAASTAKIFGMSGDAMALLVKSGAKDLAEFTKQLEGSGGAADRMAKIQLSGLSGSLTILKSSLEGVVLAFADELAPAATAFAGKLMDVANAFSALPGPVKSFIAYGTAAGGVITAMGGGVAILAARLPGAVAGIRLLGGALSAVSWGPIGIGIATVGASIAAIAWALNEYKKAKKDVFIEKEMEVIANNARQLEEGIKKVANQIVELEKLQTKYGANPAYTERIEELTEKLQAYKTELRHAKGDIFDVTATTDKMTAINEEAAEAVAVLTRPIANLAPALTALINPFKTTSKWLATNTVEMESFAGASAAFLEVSRDVKPTTDEKTEALVREAQALREANTGLVNRIKLEKHQFEILYGGMETVSLYTQSQEEQNEAMLAGVMAMNKANVAAVASADAAKAKADAIFDASKKNQKALETESKAVYENYLNWRHFQAMELGDYSAGTELIEREYQTRLAALRQYGGDAVRLESWKKEQLTALRVAEMQEWQDSVVGGVGAIGEAYYGIRDIFGRLLGDEKAFHDTWVSDMVDWVDRISKVLDSLATIWQDASTIIHKIAEVMGGDGGGTGVGAMDIAKLAQSTQGGDGASILDTASGAALAAGKASSLAGLASLAAIAAGLWGTYEVGENLGKSSFTEEHPTLGKLFAAPLGVLGQIGFGKGEDRRSDRQQAEGKAAFIEAYGDPSGWSGHTRSTWELFSSRLDPKYDDWRSNILKNRRIWNQNTEKQQSVSESQQNFAMFDKAKQAEVLQYANNLEALHLLWQQGNQHAKAQYDWLIKTGHEQERLVNALKLTTRESFMLSDELAGHSLTTALNHTGHIAQAAAGQMLYQSESAMWDETNSLLRQLVANTRGGNVAIDRNMLAEAIADLIAPTQSERGYYSA